jgi:hypothetical protein
MTRRPIIQELPPMVELNRNLDEHPQRLKFFDGYDVVSWSPGRAGECIPCTEVHFLINVPGMAFGLRLKSASALDVLVGALLRHRKDVWGPK